MTEEQQLVIDIYERAKKCGLIRNKQTFAKAIGSNGTTISNVMTGKYSGIRTAKKAKAWADKNLTIEQDLIEEIATPDPEETRMPLEDALKLIEAKRAMDWEQFRAETARQFTSALLVNSNTALTRSQLQMSIKFSISLTDELIRQLRK